ncbi:MAG: mechanosensitive ion channel [Edaphobacter sp.]|uniref:mechanosensitive ion channel family protein n=1 Tax=Edaphobacter sp. TaxID=1934404 RepID=UPI002389F61A|nr:mechanosensitive ion channel domain-containing protein [Edaphobacter sp.]MDE1177238.1 mechanosensitive ion channel [Edaphobacter sp.]
MNGAAPATVYAPVAVVMDGRTVIEIRWGIGSITPQVRAAAISERLLRLARDGSQSIDIATYPKELRIDVTQGDLVLASVFAGDAEAAGVSAPELALSWQTAFTQAINTYRVDHTRGRMLERMGLTAVVVLLTVAALWLLVPITRWVSGVISREILSRLTRAKGQSWSLIDAEQLTGIFRLLLRTIRLGVSLFVIYAAFQLLFLIYPQTKPLGEKMLAGVERPLEQFGWAAWSSAPSLIFILIIAVACRYLVQLVSFAFQRIGEGHVRMEGFKPQWAQVTSRLVNLALVLLAVLIAYPYIPGSQSAAFKGFSLFLGVLFSLGSTGVVSNVLNGVLLTYMDSFQKGDFVQIGDAQGYVETTSLFVTRLRTRQQTVITIPNSQVLGGQIINHSAAAEGSLSLSTTAGIGYDTPWRQVEAMLLNAAGKTHTVRQQPAPFVLETSLNSFDITYELTVFLTGQAPLNAVRAELNRNILDEFNQFGVQIMTPAYVRDPERPAVVPAGSWYAAPAVPLEQMPPK